MHARHSIFHFQPSFCNTKRVYIAKYCILINYQLAGHIYPSLSLIRFRTLLPWWIFPTSADLLPLIPLLTVAPIQSSTCFFHGIFGRTRCSNHSKLLFHPYTQNNIRLTTPHVELSFFGVDFELFNGIQVGCRVYLTVNKHCISKKCKHHFKFV